MNEDTPRPDINFIGKEEDEKKCVQCESHLFLKVQRSFITTQWSIIRNVNRIKTQSQYFNDCGSIFSMNMFIKNFNNLTISQEDVGTTFRESYFRKVFMIE